jgi:hypothetical protein
MSQICRVAWLEYIALDMTCKEAFVACDTIPEELSVATKPQIRNKHLRNQSAEPTHSESTFPGAVPTGQEAKEK